jgi:hypothetical protein
MVCSGTQAGNRVVQAGGNASRDREEKGEGMNIIERMINRRYRNDLSAEQVRSLLDYDPDSGNLFWKVDRSGNARKGDIAGSHSCVNGRDGYIRVQINGSRYLAHRIIWLWVTGAFPSEQIDHINLVKNDNRLSNLRQASCSENGINRLPTDRVLPRGVYPLNRKFIARIAHIHIGLFKSPEEAAEAYDIAARSIYGDFYRKDQHMTTHEFNNDSDQAERRRVQRDCYLSRAEAEAEIESQGRFKRHNPIVVIGTTPQYPSPPNGPWSTPDVSGAEPPLGYEINALPELGGAAPADLPCAVEPASPREGSFAEDTSDPSPFSSRMRRRV